MPRSRASHLWRVIWDNYTIETIPLECRQNPYHVHITFIDKCLMVIWDLPFDISQMDIGYATLAAILVDRVIYVSLSHLGQGPNAQLQRIVTAPHRIKYSLIHNRLIDESGLATHSWHRRVVWVQRKTHARFLRYWNDLFQELSESTPQFIVRDGGQDTLGSILVDHVPNCSFGERNIIGGTVHAYSNCVASPKWTGDTSADSSNAEVIAKDRNLCFSHPSHDCFDVLNLLRPPRTI